MDFLLIGFDGLDWRAYKTFGRHFTRRPMRSPFPLTGPAWTSIYTGLTADAHGVYNVYGQEEGLYKSATGYTSQCVWARLPQDARIGLFNMPVAFPPTDRTGGFYVPGFPCYYAPEMQTLSQPALPDTYFKERDWLEERVEVGTWYLDKSVFEILERMRGSQLQLTEDFIKLATVNDVAFGAVGFRYVDRICHTLGTRYWEWSEGERLGIVLADDIIDQLVQRLKPKRWLVVSDHGTFRDHHRDLGVLIGDVAFEPEFASRKWWSTRDPAGLIAKVLGLELLSPATEAMPYNRLSGIGQPAASRKIWDAIQAGTPIRLNLGCGPKVTQISEPGWINIDAMNYEGIDLLHDLENGLPFPDEFAEEIVALDVLEHLSYVISGDILGEWCRVLKPGGILRLRSPDLGTVAKTYAAGRLDLLALMQKAYGRACSKDWDTHFCGVDWEWLTGQLAYWGCIDVTRLPDPDPYSLLVQAIKGPTTQPVDDSYTLEERLVVQKRLEDLGYL